jgi:hypothetical protein
MDTQTHGCNIANVSLIYYKRYFTSILMQQNSPSEIQYIAKHPIQIEASPQGGRSHDTAATHTVENIRVIVMLISRRF